MEQDAHHSKYCHCDTSEHWEHMAGLTTDGFYHCRLSSPSTLEFVSDRICELLGYSREEIHELFQTHYSLFIHKDDRKKFNEKFRTLASAEGQVTTSFRIVTRDGRIRYISEVMRSALDRDGIMHGYACAHDITAQLLLEEKLSSLERRYQQTQATLEDTYQRYSVSNYLLGTIIFKYDIASNRYLPLNDSNHPVDNTLHLFNYSETELVARLNELLQQDENHIHAACGEFFHADDVPKLEKALSQLKETQEFKLELRAKQSEHTYLWCSVMGKLIRDEDGTPQRIVGTINNIDQSHRKNEELLRVSQREPLTGLLNKTSAIQMIKTVLESREEHNHALMILDLDDFKAINDEMGHAFGDEVIVSVARHLKNTFRSTDIIARFGGDEFMVFLPDVSSEHVVVQKAELLRQIFEETEVGNHPEYKVSCSIGISISCGEKNFGKLFQQADSVLYQSKRDGKNRATVYA